MCICFKLNRQQSSQANVTTFDVCATLTMGIQFTEKKKTNFDFSLLILMSHSKVDHTALYAVVQVK